jgi:hypothetical protein
MSYQPMGQHIQRKNKTKWKEPKPAKTPEHDFGQNRPNALQINGPPSRFQHCGMAVMKIKR